MTHVSHKLKGSFEGALAGGGDPATSPLYVFGPLLKLIVVGGVARVTFGASIWMVVATVILVSAMYRRVMIWVTDGSGGSGLAEEELGRWAAKVNAGITFIEYTLTFLVSMAALVTFVADRFPILNGKFLDVLAYRTILACLLSVGTGWVVNRGPKVAARAFGPATAMLLLLLWGMVIATIAQRGIQLPNLDLAAFKPEYLHFTIGGYARVLALMTGIEIFANLVAAYDGPPAAKSKKAFGSLVIIMGTTVVTMIIVGPAILALSDPSDPNVSVFTQTMDALLPQPLPYIGTLVGIAVLLSASAASAQGLQNLALGLRFRHYVPAWIGQRNQYDVADAPVWIEVILACACFLAFGTHEETYLALYAAGVFILLSMTGWAASKRLFRQLRERFSIKTIISLIGTVIAALLTSGATLIIFRERFVEGAWTYLIFIPALYVVFSRFRSRLGDPTPVEERLGVLTAGRYLATVAAEGVDAIATRRIVVPLDQSAFSEQALHTVRGLHHAYGAGVKLISVDTDPAPTTPDEREEVRAYLSHVAATLAVDGIKVEISLARGDIAEQIVAGAKSYDGDAIVMTTHGRAGIERWIAGSVARRVMQLTDLPLFLARPTDDWRSRRSRFQRILVPLDGSTEAERALPHVTSLAARFGSAVELLYVTEEEGAADYASKVEAHLSQIASKLSESGVAAHVTMSSGGPGTAIISVAEASRADLIVMTTGGWGKRGTPEPDQDHLGSVADRVVQNTRCPVLLVPLRGKGAAGGGVEGAPNELGAPPPPPPQPAGDVA